MPKLPPPRDRLSRSTYRFILLATAVILLLPLSYGTWHLWKQLGQPHPGAQAVNVRIVIASLGLLLGSLLASVALYRDWQFQERFNASWTFVFGIVLISLVPTLAFLLAPLR